MARRELIFQTYWETGNNPKPRMRLVEVRVVSPRPRRMRKRRPYIPRSAIYDPYGVKWTPC
jgi:hypothetical protein